MIDTSSVTMILVLLTAGIWHCTFIHVWKFEGFISEFTIHIPAQLTQA